MFLHDLSILPNHNSCHELIPNPRVYIGIERGNSRRKNEEISGWKTRLSTRKLKWYASTITDVFLNHKKVNACVLIEKDICDCRNVSVKLPCVYVCLSSWDLFIISVRVSSLYSNFCYPYFCTFRFNVVYIRSLGINSRQLVL